ncbi:MAG: ATP-dependent protease ATPase subunit HslU, partial [Oceanococcaceae bacterium]
VRERAMDHARPRAELDAEERILDALLPRAEGEAAPSGQGDATRQVFRKKLREGQLDDKEVTVEVSGRAAGVEIMGPPGMEEMTNQLQSLFRNMQQQRSRARKMRVADALKALTDEEAAKHVDEEKIRIAALQEVEQNGIVFIDEIDKVCKRENTMGADVSREGVQRDLLPLVEGCTVTTKYGVVKTDHILFIASGAFHLAKPSDLIPELQGRLPIRVELSALSAEDFQRILTEPDFCLTAQYSALLQTEGLELRFADDGVRRLAELATQVNSETENIGARRLHTLLERLLEEVSFTAPDKGGDAVTVDAAMVEQRLAKLVGDQDLSQYIL